MEDYPLRDEDRIAFQENGHILLRGVATAAELAAYQEAIRETAYRFNTERRKLAERDTYGKAFLQIMNLWRRDECVKEFVFFRKFARLAADLLGVERVRLYHDQALFKEAGGGATPWHQDQYYWPLDTDRTITMWMPLVDVSAEMGLMRFVSGSHRLGAIRNIEISDESEAVYDQFVKEQGLPISQTLPMQAGDATFHLGWTMHSAGANHSATAREVMTIIYFADGARVTAPRSKHQQADLETWLDNKAPGELADSYLNPLLNP